MKNEKKIPVINSVAEPEPPGTETARKTPVPRKNGAILVRE